MRRGRVGAVAVPAVAAVSKLRALRKSGSRGTTTRSRHNIIQQARQLGCPVPAGPFFDTGPARLRVTSIRQRFQKAYQALLDFGFIIRRHQFRAASLAQQGCRFPPFAYEREDGPAHAEVFVGEGGETAALLDRKSTRLNSSHPSTSYAVFCLKKKKNT